MRNKGANAGKSRMAEAALDVGQAPGAMLDRRRSVLLIADPERDLGGIADMIDAADLRVLAQVAPEDAPDRLERTAAIDLLLVRALADDWSDGLRSLLLRLDQMARAGDAALIVFADAATVDRVYAAIETPDAQILLDPSLVEILTAVPLTPGAIDGPMLVEFHDVSRESEAARLARLSEEISRLAKSLAASSGYGAHGSERVEAAQVEDRSRRYSAEPGLVPPLDEAPVSASAIRTILRARRMRDQMFPEGLFADPAWDMLLDLTAARLESEKVSVSSLCIAAAVPPTTALRWIRNLTEQGIFQRQADYHDGRRVFIALSDSAFAAMTAYFRSAQRLGPIAG